MVDGAARDSALIRELPLPYFVRSVTPVAGSTGDAYGACQGTVTVGGASVSPGDVVFGDADGVLVGSIEAFEAVVDKAEAVAAVEDALSESSPPLSATGTPSLSTPPRCTCHLISLVRPKERPLNVHTYFCVAGECSGSLGQSRRAGLAVAEQRGGARGESQARRTVSLSVPP